MAVHPRLLYPLEIPSSPWTRIPELGDTEKYIKHGDTEKHIKHGDTEKHIKNKNKTCF